MTTILLISAWVLVVLVLTALVLRQRRSGRSEPVDVERRTGEAVAEHEIRARSGNAAAQSWGGVF